MRAETQPDEGDERESGVLRASLIMLGCGDFSSV